MTNLFLGANPIRRALYLTGFTPAVWYFYCGVSDQLGADPQKTLERLLGLWALRFLIASLAVTPLRSLGGPNLIRYRRTLGLLAFYYALLHLTVYMLLDQGLDLPSIWADLVKRPYITFGMLGFVILVPLAATSNGPMIRRLRGGRWQALHRLVYLAALAAVAHYLLLVKVVTAELLVYAGLVGFLLAFRLYLAVHPRVVHATRQSSSAARSAPSL